MSDAQPDASTMRETAPPTAIRAMEQAFLRQLRAEHPDLHWEIVDERSPLECVECRATASGAAPGWRSFLTIDDEVATYCPECAEREFGSS